MSRPERETLIDWPEPLPRDDDTVDAAFYTFPRLVTHIDDGAIGAVTALYRETLPPGGRILDLMSSWISHLPQDVEYAEVVGIGMNATELARNRRLTGWSTQDLNEDAHLGYRDAHFDAVVVCVSIDYLIRPTDVLREIARITKPDGRLVITFSNRCFPTKVVSPWLVLDDAGRLDFVARRVERAGGWTEVTRLDRSPPGGDPLFAVVARRAA
jgi:SAM-dependent methyltransferase